ncbi:hypothetical protein MLD38_024236 [Melastoma candidum]|uniref:Uncharacterized protein n=1 Tax=Melastoma candidum TaxID=119954 RepID=A0ACB9NSJ8_9MYRT|nr:hypothetical protein MLD38_024236 [Melastoma candidum]
MSRNFAPSLRHERHKEHPLTLCMPPKDETNKYYCEICAERRHPDYWIYYCKGCGYEAHPHCVVQGIPAYSYEEGGIHKILEDNAPEPADFEDGMRKVLWELREKNKGISKRWYDYI